MKKLFGFIRYGDKLANSHKHAMSVYTIWLSIIVLAVVLYIINTTPELIKQEPISGEIISVSSMKDDSRHYGWLLEIFVEDGNKVRLMVTRHPVPDIGDTIPLVKETYDDGEVLYSFSSDFYFSQY